MCAVVIPMVKEDIADPKNQEYKNVKRVFIPYEFDGKLVRLIAMYFHGTKMIFLKILLIFFFFFLYIL